MIDLHQLEQKMYGRGDYFFSEATEANRALVEGQQVILVKNVSETNRFGRLRYIAVKGRRAGANTVTITKNEILTAINSGEQFILAWSRSRMSRLKTPRYVRRPYQKEPDFGVTSINYNLAELKALSERPG